MMTFTGNPRSAASVLLLIGLLFSAIASLSGHQQLQLKRHGLTAPGTVVNLVRHKAQKGGYADHAVVRFATADGQTVQFEDHVGGRPPLIRVGDAVPVMYLPDSPTSSAWVDRGFWNLLPMFLLGGLGLLCLSIGVSVLRHPAPQVAFQAAFQAQLRSGQPAARPTAPDVSDATAWPTHYEVWALVLFLVALGLMFAPPHNKTGDAALGVFLCILVGVLAVIFTVIDSVARFFLAGASAAVAVREGAAQGLDADEGPKAWAQAAGKSAKLQSVLSHYAHLRRGVWTAGIVTLLISIWLTGSSSVLYLLRH